MQSRTPEVSRRTAARVAGICLLLIIAFGVAGTAIGRDHILVHGDAVATAQHMLAHELQFRIGTAFEILMFNCDVVLAVALYVLLKPIGAPLALLGAFWRVANAIVLALSVAFSLAALDLIEGTRYLSVFKTDQLQAQARFFLDMHETGSLVGLVFFSFGAGVHSYLLLKSACIPRLLSGFYLAGVVWLLLCCFGFIVVPGSMKGLDIAFIVPDFLAELLVGLWLTFKSVNLPQPT